MLNTIIIAENPFEPDTWEKFEHEGDIRPFLADWFEEFPETARIYHNQVAEEYDVTPNNETEVERLGKLEGKFYVIVYAGEPITIALVVIGIVAVAAVALALSAPDVPNPSRRNVRSESPNNSLSDRQNEPRVNGRIPDIFGTVRSTPDLLAVPYSVYKNNVEFEYAYMCVGKGEFDVSDIKDGETSVADIEGSIVEVFGPGTSPNSGDTPQVTDGDPAVDPIEEPVYLASRSNAINGQTLKAPNADSIVGSSNIKFADNGSFDSILAATGTGSDINFLDIMGFQENITISNSSIQITPAGPSYPTVVRSLKATYSTFSGIGGIVFDTASEAANFPVDSLMVLGVDAVFTPPGGGSVDLSGTYLVNSSDSLTGEVLFDLPVLINSNWTQVDTLYPADETESKNVTVSATNTPFTINLDGNYDVITQSSSELTIAGGKDAAAAINSDWIFVRCTATSETPFTSAILERINDPWIGPFDLELDSLTEVFSNFVALNGLYKESSTAQVTTDVDIELELTPIDNTGTPTGPAETFTTTIVGSAVLKSTRASTLQADPTFTGRCRVRARRTTNTDLSFVGQVVDEVKWKDLYGMAEIADNDFGDVTTVHSVTQATEGALAVKNRKLNMLVTRKIPTQISGSTFTTALTATNRADEIISFVCLDEFIGKRSVDEIDFDNIYDTVAEIETYFGTAKAVEFSYTFDSDNLSFEETLTSICNAIHCKPFRQGNQIKINFEKETEDSILLFNHRNKLPGSETRTLRFANLNEHDGVEFEYTDPANDLIETFYIPTDKSAKNAKKIETLGIRDRLQAYFHAYRAWNKIQYQNLISEFEGTQEANLITINDRILVADNTRDTIQDGQVVSQNGLELTLSQTVDLTQYASYKIFLQHTDGTVESLDITAGTESNQVVLGQAPKQALALDPELFAVCTYLIVGNTEQSTSAFLVSEKTPQSNFTTIVRTINYDARYYQNDLDFDNGIVDSEGNVI